MNFVYAYLRASTSEQDANRARKQLDQFVADHGSASPPILLKTSLVQPCTGRN